MISSNYAGAAQHGSASIALRAEAYLACLHDTSDCDLKATLVNGMVLVSGLLGSDTNSVPTQESHRTLAKLVVAKMQRMAREAGADQKQQTYPCFSS